MRFAPYEISSAARADALFASALQRSDEPSARQVEQAIAEAIRAFGDVGCAARVAQEYGEHPEMAASRMRWARAAASACTAREPARPAAIAGPARRGPDPQCSRLLAAAAR